MSGAGRGEGTWLEVRLGARLASVRVLNELLDVALRAAGVDGAARHDATLAVAELVANVVEHERGDEVGVRVDARPGELVVTVTSRGTGFDLEAVLARVRARDPLESSSEGGLGLLMLDTLFDVRAERHPATGHRITLRRLG